MAQLAYWAKNRQGRRKERVSTDRNVSALKMRSQEEREKLHLGPTEDTKGILGSF
jgi:hypothetical protein